VDVAAAAGLRFRHSNGARGRHMFVETTGSGCALFDYDNDGWLDLLLLQAGPLPGTPERARADATHALAPPPAGVTEAAANRLYRNRGDGTFADVTAGSGLECTGYSQGVAVGDWDNDGFDDLYVTAYGGNHLFRNERGTGRFRDVTARAGVANTEAGPRWSVSAAFGDDDGDGDLDLFVCHYVKWAPAIDHPCHDGYGNPSYCHPHAYDGETVTLYRNNGDATFTDVTRAAGLAGLVGRGLGVTWLDFNDDGRPDLYVANDLTPNFLLRNNGGGTFTDVAMEAGVAVSDSGTLLSGMGIGVGDTDGDGREDLFVTNFSKQGNSLYRNDGGGAFSNRTYASGIGTISLNWLGFGCAFLDEDLDGRLDLLVANGHVMDNVALTEREITYAERKSLYHNRGDGTFVDIAAGAGDLAVSRVSRGLAIGDFDNDGAMDALVNNQNDTPQLLRGTARSRYPERHWLSLRLQGTHGKRDAYHARVTVQSGGRTQVREVRSGFSFASASDRRVHFGLGSAAVADTVTIRWPGGHTDRFRALPADRIYVVTEGRGIERRR
jgi:enediyne biosynthesis protein E4